MTPAHVPLPSDPPAAAPAPPPQAPEVQSSRLLVTLGGGGAIAGFLIVFVFGATQPTIQAHKEKMLREAIEEVLQAPQRYDTLYLYNGGLTASLPAGVDPRPLERVYLGYRDDQHPVGFAIAAAGPGFQDAVKLIFGYDPATGTLLGMKVLESKETPGLGDKIEKSERFVTQFAGAQPPLRGVKSGAKHADDAGQIEMITGATISSRAVIRTIDKTIERFKPLLTAYRPEGRS